MSIRGWIALLVLAGLATGCGAARRCPLPEAGPDAALAVLPEGVESLSGEFMAELDAPGVSRRVNLLVAAESSGRLRFEAVGPVGALYVAVVDGGRFAGIDIAGRRWYEGPADRSLLERLAGIRIDPGEMIASLLAAPPLPDGQIEAACDRAVVRGPDGSVRATLEFHPGGRLKRFGLPHLSVWYGGWQGEGRTAYPRTVRFDLPDERVRLTLKGLGRPETGQTLDPRLFALERPDGFEPAADGD